MREGIDQQRARFQAALNRTGFDPTSVSPKLSEGTGNVIMSLSHFEELVGPRQGTVLQPIVRAAGDGVALSLDDRTVELTHAQTIELCRAIVEALGGFERLVSR
jgi:hypothetical protein